MTDVAVLIPVLGRPHRAAPVIASLANASPDAQPVFVCTAGDDKQIAACVATDIGSVFVADWPAGRGDYARKIQFGFDSTDTPFVFQGADDLTFMPGWLDRALEAIDRDGGYGVCGTWDGANPSVMRGVHATHSLIRRSYVDECGASWDGPGTVLSTAYSHQRVDNELVELAKWRGCWTFAKRSRVLHHHPIYDRSVARDATYLKAMADGVEDGHLFAARRRQWETELERAA